jgi:hypothetical protein
MHVIYYITLCIHISLSLYIYIETQILNRFMIRMSRGKIPKTRFLLKAAVILLVLSLSFLSFKSPSLPVVRVQATSFNDVCANSNANTAFTGFFGEMSLMVPLSGFDEEDELGKGGAAFGNNDKSWTTCSPGADSVFSSTFTMAKVGKYFVCDRQDVDTNFNWETDCHALMPAEYKANEMFGSFGAIFSNDGKNWSVCSESYSTTSAHEVGQCYICDRASVDVQFDWDANCHDLLSPIVEDYVKFGWGGPTLSNNGLIFSTCSRQERCYVCYRDAVNVDFLPANCHVVAPSDANGGDDFGNGGAALSGSGLSFSACSAYADSNGLADVGKCFVCDRASVDVQFDWDRDCSTLVPDQPLADPPADYPAQAEDLFGLGGSVLSNDALTFSACSANADLERSGFFLI